MSETSISVSIDVPSLANGIAFYGQAFGFEVSARPAPGIAGRPILWDFEPEWKS